MPGPIAQEEMVIAEAVRQASLWALGRNLGPPKRHDDGSRDAMFDIVYSFTDPPVALEVTRIVDSDHLKTHRAAQTYVDQILSRVVEQTGRSEQWSISIEAGCSMNTVRRDLESAIETGEIPARLPPGVLRVECEPAGGPAVTFVIWSAPTKERPCGLADDLERAIGDNLPKLRSAVDYERHLAVDVQAVRSSDPAATPAPELPDGIDRLWVLRRAYSALRGYPVVWTTTGSGSWRVNGEPHEAM